MEFLKHALPVNPIETQELNISVYEIIDSVRRDGDKALVKYNTRFDGNNRESLRVTREEIEAAYKKVEPELLEDMRLAAEHIRKFALAQKETIRPLENFEQTPGLVLGHRIIPVDSCLCYVPGGNYPLYSSALMLVIPAKAAGVKRIAACSPAVSGSTSIHPLTLAALDIAGADEIYALGGAHGIAAFTYGTEQIKPVDMIVGPGNQYVTEAKRQCFGKVGIDFIAGPSEVLTICDDTGNASFIAADMIAQSEHDLKSKGIVITTDKALGINIIKEVERQLEKLSTRERAKKAWIDNGEVIFVDSVEEACRLSNEYAPEHLELHIREEGEGSAVSLLNNYGSLFIGALSAEVFGDYISGTNHTLPTVKASRYTGGVYVGTFLKTCTYQKINREGLEKIGMPAYRMAKGEGLHGHANAALIRL